MARAGRELAIAHRAQLAAQGLLGDRDAELLPEPLRQIDQTASAPRRGPPGSGPCSMRPQGRAMRGVEPGGLAGRLAVDQARWPIGVETGPAPGAQADPRWGSSCAGWCRPRWRAPWRRCRSPPSQAGETAERELGVEDGPIGQEAGAGGGARGAGRPVIDRGQGQKAPRLRAVLGRAGDRAQRGSSLLRRA